jgi:CobQ-like glutamine amidotransferase family enzyme
MQTRLQWHGYESSVVAVNKGEQIPPDADFIFLGHGSMAAWTDINENLLSLAPEIKIRISAGVAFMAVSTGHERAIELGIFPGAILNRERVSKFEVVSFEGKEVLGYLNSATDAPVIQKNGLSIGTQLHGPIFAKNPTLVDAYLAEILGEQNIDLPRSPESSSNETTELTAGTAKEFVDQIVDQVWELERELASE